MKLPCFHDIAIRDELQTDVTQFWFWCQTVFKVNLNSTQGKTDKMDRGVNSYNTWQPRMSRSTLKDKAH